MTKAQNAKVLYGTYNQILKSLYPEMKVKEVRNTGGGGKSRLCGL